jgi:hypothetical protein
MFAAWPLAFRLTGLADSLGVMVFHRILPGVGESIYLLAATEIVSNLYARKERGLSAEIFKIRTHAGLPSVLPWLAYRSFAWDGKGCSWQGVYWDWSGLFRSCCDIQNDCPLRG